MSTMVRIKQGDRTEARPGLHLNEDALDEFDAPCDGQGHVKLPLDGVAVRAETLSAWESWVTISLPRDTARVSGLIASVSTAENWKQA